MKLSLACDTAPGPQEVVDGNKCCRMVPSPLNWFLAQLSFYHEECYSIFAPIQKAVRMGNIQERVHEEAERTGKTPLSWM